MKAWEAVRLEFPKHLKMRANIPTVKEALGEHVQNQHKLRAHWRRSSHTALQLTVSFFFQAHLTISNIHFLWSLVTTSLPVWTQFNSHLLI